MAFEALRERVISGALAPGAKLNIASLAVELAVSNGAIREALAMLEAESLAVSEAMRGWRVSLISPSDLAHLTQARIAVEKLCLHEAMRHGGVEWESAVVGALHRLSSHREWAGRSALGQSQEWILAHAEFHKVLAEGCPNPWLRSARETLYRQSERYRQFSTRRSSQGRDVAGEHRALVEALLARSAKRVDRLVEEHFSRTAERVVAGLVQTEASEIEGQDAVAPGTANRTPRGASTTPDKPRAPPDRRAARPPSPASRSSRAS